MTPGLGGGCSVDRSAPRRSAWWKLRLVPRFLRMVWRAQPYYPIASVSLPLVLAFKPVPQLWIGKLIIDAKDQHRLQVHYRRRLPGLRPL